MADDIFNPDDEVEEAPENALAQQAMSLMGMETVQKLQKRIIGIQTGAEQPPDWFQRTGFDTGTVTIETPDGTLEFDVVAASSAAMEALERANEKTEMICEQNAVIECLARIPEEYKLRRPFKTDRNKTFNAGHHWENLWGEYESNPKGARQIAGQLLGGKLYAMLKMAMMWLSKVTISDLVEMDPEEGDEKRPPD